MATALHDLLSALVGVTITRVKPLAADLALLEAEWPPR
jgi:hypothetical protein